MLRHTSGYVIADVLKRAKTLTRDAFTGTKMETAYERDGVTFKNQDKLQTILVQAQGGRWVSVRPPEIATSKPVFPSSVDDAQSISGRNPRQKKALTLVGAAVSLHSPT
jgi:hypothetical protein